MPLRVNNPRPQDRASIANGNCPFHNGIGQIAPGSRPTSRVGMAQRLRQETREILGNEPRTEAGGTRLHVGHLTSAWA